jgi:hypothetical protein
MATRTIATLREIVDSLQLIASSHEQINDFAFNQMQEINTATRKYPLLYVEIGNAQVIPPDKTTNGYTALTLNIGIYDRLDQGLRNHLDVANDTYLIINDVIAQLCKDLLFSNFKVQGASSLQYSYLEQLDFIVGWQSTTTFKINGTLNACQVPSDLTAGSPLIICEPSVVRNTDSSYSQSVASGGLLIVPDCVITDTNGDIINLPATESFICTVPENDLTEVWNASSEEEKKSLLNSTITDIQLDSLLDLDKRNKLNYLLPTGNSLLASYANGDPESSRWDTSRSKFFTLTTNNRFGNNSRFTDLNGVGKTLWNTEFLIDHAYGVLLCKKNNTQAFDALNWANAMAFAVNHNGLSYNDWLIPDDKYFVTLVYRGNNLSSFARLFWLNIQAVSNNFWTSVTDGYSSTTQAVYFAGVAANAEAANKTSAHKFFLYRKIKETDNLLP